MCMRVKIFQQSIRLVTINTAVIQELVPFSLKQNTNPCACYIVVNFGAAHVLLYKPVKIPL